MLHTDDGIRFGVTVPDLPGCFSAGDTFDDAFWVLARNPELMPFVLPYALRRMGKITQRNLSKPCADEVSMIPIALEVDDTHPGIFRVGERQDRKGAIGEAGLRHMLDYPHPAQYAAEPLLRPTKPPFGLKDDLVT